MLVIGQLVMVGGSIDHDHENSSAKTVKTEVSFDIIE